ncbi:MAG: LamG-like jellyroll fold domain-containing protein [Bacteroidales bacterium]|nr:LamG-like jellyroll fold domain-containing protein [Bacteroidales bacterium]
MKKNLLFSSIAILGFTIATMAQIPAYVPSNGLLAWYPLTGNSNDLSPNLNNAVNTGVTFTTDRFEHANSAGSFDGYSSGLVVAAPSFTFDENGAFTYSVWIKKDILTPSGIVLMVATVNAGNFISMLAAGEFFTYATNMQQSSWMGMTIPVTTNVWDNYVATYDAKIMNLYKNGIFQSTNAYTHTGAVATNLPLFIGRSFDGSSFNGLIDDIGIWNRSLTQSEITGLYQSITVGTRELTKDNLISIYPNPASGHINLKANENLAGSVYSIRNPVGKTLLQGKLTGENTTINLEKLSKGIYLISFGEDARQTIKFIKN